MATTKPDYSRVLKHLQATNKDVIEICKPLFNNLAINLFSYKSIRQDGSFVIFESDSNSAGLWYRNGYPMPMPELNKTKDGIYFWENSGLTTDALQIYQDNGYKHGICIVRTGKDFIEQYAFATPTERSKLIDFCYTNRELMENFIMYFKVRGISLIKTANKNPFYANDFCVHIIETKDKEEPYKKFREQIKLNKIHLLVNSDDIVITLREYQCLMHLSKGKSAKEIGKILNISCRTVESHLANIKTKTGCVLTSQLIDMFWTNFANKI